MESYEEPEDWPPTLASALTPKTDGEKQWGKNTHFRDTTLGFITLVGKY